MIPSTVTYVISCIIFLIIRILGIVLIGRASFETLKAVVELTFKKKSLSKIYGKGSYALITDATSVLGLQFCERLASEGFNLILYSSCQRDLDVMEGRLTRSGVKVVAFYKDFSSDCNPGFFDQISEELKPFDVSIVINSLHMGAQELSSTNSAHLESEIQRSIALGPHAQLGLIYCLIPQLKERAPRRTGYVSINSISSLLPIPGNEFEGVVKYFNYLLQKGVSRRRNLGNIDFLLINQIGVIGLPYEEYIKEISNELDNLGRLQECYHCPRQWKLMVYFMNSIKYITPYELVPYLMDFFTFVIDMRMGKNNKGGECEQKEK